MSVTCPSPAVRIRKRRAEVWIRMCRGVCVLEEAEWLTLIWSRFSLSGSHGGTTEACFVRPMPGDAERTEGKKQSMFYLRLAHRAAASVNRCVRCHILSVCSQPRMRSKNVCSERWVCRRIAHIKRWGRCSGNRCHQCIVRDRLSRLLTACTRRSQSYVLRRVCVLQ